MNHKLVLLILLMLTGNVISAQSGGRFVFQKKISGDISGFAVDVLDNIYLLNSTDQLKKIDSKGDSVSVFNDVKNFGQLSLIDVSNPLKVLLYYKDFGRIIILDRLLGVRNTIDLRKLGLLQVRAIGQAYDNNIWLYDEVNNKLKKINEDGKLMMETTDFRQLMQPPPLPQLIIDRDRYVYLYDSSQAVYVFDYFGTLKNTLAIKGWKNLQVSANNVFGTSGNRFYSYNLKTFKTDEGELPADIHDFSSLQFINGKLYVLKEGSVYIYEFKNINTERNQ